MQGFFYEHPYLNYPSPKNLGIPALELYLALLSNSLLNFRIT